MQYDVFISYRHARKCEVLALCEQLKTAGLVYFRDEERRDDDASIQRTIEAGLAASKLLLAWFDPTYLQSKACAWELSRALLAAQANGGGLQRIVCVDPSRRFSHIVPESLADQARLVSLDDPSALVGLLRERASVFDGPLGAITAGIPPCWYERERPTHPTWVGRASELIKLFDQLDRGRLAMHGGERAPVAVTGWGGEGKTMLAEQYALRFAPAYPGGVVWLSGATSREGYWQQQLESELDLVARGRLGIAVDDLLRGTSDPVRRIRALKQAIDRKLTEQTSPNSPTPIAPYLWIIDDLPDRLSAQEQRLWLAPNDRAHCIATLRESGGVGAVFHHLPVPSLEEAEAIRLLTRRDELLNEDERTMAREIVEALGRLPLALELGAALVSALGYRRYLELLRAPASTDALERLVQSLGTALPTDHERSIVKTFLRSLDQLPGADDDNAPAEQRASWIVLRLAALIAPEPLPDTFALRVLSAFGFNETDAELLKDLALTTLHRAAVIRRGDTAGFDQSGIHTLLAQIVVEVRLSPEQRSAVLARAIYAAREWLKDEAIKPPVDADRRLLAVVLPLSRRAGSTEAAWLANEVGEFARGLGRLSESKRLCEESYTIRKALLGEEHRDTLISMHNLASTMQEQGDLPAALEIQKRVLVVCRRLQGGDHPDTLGAMHNLAWTMYEQGDLPAAREMQVQVVALRSQVQGEEHPDTLGSINDLAVTMQAQLDHAGARALLEPALDISCRALGAEHRETLVMMSNLATTLQSLGRLSAARAMQEEVLAVCRSALGEEHPDTLSSMVNLGSIVQAQGDLAGARVMQDQSTVLCSRVLSDDHPTTLRSMTNLAATMFFQGGLPSARALQEKALDAQLRLLGEEHHATQTSMNNLAWTMQAQGDLSSARAMRERRKEIQRRVQSKGQSGTK